MTLEGNQSNQTTLTVHMGANRQGSILINTGLQSGDRDRLVQGNGFNRFKGSENR
jgi:hypothetical protein